jgi:predicted PurR-regulated permease PerM
MARPASHEPRPPAPATADRSPVPRREAPLPWWVKQSVWVVPIALAIGTVYLLGGTLAPFLVGAALAYALDPLADRLEARGMRRGVAAALLTTAVFGLLVAVVLLFLPLLIVQLQGLIAELPGYLENLRQLLPRLVPLAERFGVPEAFTTEEGLVRQFAERALRTAGAAAGTIWTSGLAVLDVLLLVLLTPFVTFYQLRDWDRVRLRINELLPRRHAPTIRRLAGEINTVIAGFVRGQGLVCLWQAVFHAVGLWLIGLRFGLIIGVLTGVLALIPVIGNVAMFVVAVAVALFQFEEWWRVGAVVLLYGAAQILEQNVLYPRLVGGRVSLHPVWVIFALLAGGHLFGFVGALLSVPVAAAIAVLIRFAIQRYTESSLYHGER